MHSVGDMQDNFIDLLEFDENQKITFRYTIKFVHTSQRDDDKIIFDA